VGEEAVIGTRLARARFGQRAAWVLPAVLAAAVTGYIAWGAWVSAADPGWLMVTGAWWRAGLRPGNLLAPLALVAAWLAALLCYWWPRRLQPKVVGLATVVAMVVIGGVLSCAALTPCRGGQTESAVVGWMLDLYVGNPPTFALGACTSTPSLAFQLAGPVSLGATLTGALAAAAVLWRQPLGRLRARLVADATVLVGLDALTMPLLQQLARTRRPASIVVIEPDPGHPLLEEARATGARVMIADASLPQVLLPVLAAAGRSCALRYLYALRQDAAENEAILAAASGILERYRPDPERQPHLIARIDDPRHADHWRGRHSGTSALWFEDALSPLESTACALVNQVCAGRPRQLLLCGDNTLALAILLELARRAWEQRELRQAAAIGRATPPGRNGQAAAGADATRPGTARPGTASPDAASPDAASPDAASPDAASPDAASPDAASPEPASPEPASRENGGPRAPAPHPVQRVVLVDRRAEDLRREYLASCPPSVAAAAPPVHAEPGPWRDRLLAMLDGMRPAEADHSAVVIADAQTPGGLHEAGRVARLHPRIPLFVLACDGTAASEAIFDRLRPFPRTFLVDGQPPEDTWTRVARHWHECHRMRQPAAGGGPPARTGRPWADLDEFIRQDNILQLRSVMAAVVARGRQWVPARAVLPGSFIELTEQDVEAVARAEHTRWYRRRLAAGWSAIGGPGPGENDRTNSRVVPWAQLPGAERSRSIDFLRSQLAQLEDVGFVPVVPAGGPALAAEFRRVGTVRARRLQVRRRWTRLSGDELHGNAGDWRVVDDSGDERTVKDPEFRHSHELLGGERWRRTGTVRAWQVSEKLVLRTMEGQAIARPGDWVVESRRGERWPVTDRQFRRSYIISADPVAGPPS
jgi:hypothetical protein